MIRWSRELRSIATIGITVFGPLALIAFLVLLATSVGGTPRLVVTIAVVTIPALGFFVALYLAVDTLERQTDASGAPADDEGP